MAVSSSTLTFRELLERQWERGRFVCVGLDPDLGRIPSSVTGRTPGEKVYNFLQPIIDATAPIIGCYKPQSAYFERLRGEGSYVLQRVVRRIRRVAPGVPIILDAKRGDIGDTNEGYVDAFFDWLEVDALTINPYLGQIANLPFLEQAKRGLIVLCRTSNNGAGEFQDRLVLPTAEEAQRWGIPAEVPMPFYQLVAYRVSREWNTGGNCCLVAGATWPLELKEIRAIVGDEVPLLIPGIGAQGGDIKATVQAGADSRGRGMIINNSRGILYAHQQRTDLEPRDFAQASADAAQAMHDQITAALAARKE